MHNVLGQSKQMHSSFDGFVFVRVYLICLIRFSTKTKQKRMYKTVIINEVIT